MQRQSAGEALYVLYCIGRWLSTAFAAAWLLLDGSEWLSVAVGFRLIRLSLGRHDCKHFVKCLDLTSSFLGIYSAVVSHFDNCGEPQHHETACNKP